HGAWRREAVMRRRARGLDACRFALVTAMLTLVTGCVVGPEYVRPTVLTPDAYKEVDGWIVGRPQDDAPRGAWWEIFADPQLNAQASAADLETSRLSLQAELAQDYFQLRALDAQKQLLDITVAAFQKSLELTRNRYEGGVASRADVAQAETQLKTTQAQAID